MNHRLRTLWAEARFVGGEPIRRAPWIVLMMLAAAMLDLLGVGLIAPFVGLMMNPVNPAAVLPGTVLSWLGDRPLRSLGGILIAVFALKGIAAFVLQGLITRFTERIRVGAMGRLLHAYQHADYAFHLKQSSSDLINRVVWHTQAFASGMVGSGMRLVADALVFVALGLLIAWANPVAMVLLACILAVVYFAIIKLVRHRGAQLNASVAASTADVMHSTQQALGGLREIRVLGCEDYFHQRLQHAGQKLVDATAMINVINLIPRHTIEFAMVLFLVVLIFVSNLMGESRTELIPLLGLIGASAVRLMPASTALLTNFYGVRNNRFAAAVLAQDMREIEKVLPENSAARLEESPMPVDAKKATEWQAFQSLRTEGLTFSYATDSPNVVDGLEIEIRAGEIVGLVGPSGAGKSTLVDLLLGLLKPKAGRVLVNGQNINDDLREWQQRVAYIPQQSYLIDDSIRRNVALGVPDAKIDDAKVWRALRDASLEEQVRQLPHGLDTALGERGVRFSGGQRQRISIARALYHDREFLVLDEATSALDGNTEREVVATIQALRGKKTILLIAHRDSTLALANRHIRCSTKSEFNTPTNKEEMGVL